MVAPPLLEERTGILPKTICHITSHHKPCFVRIRQGGGRGGALPPCCLLPFQGSICAAVVVCLCHQRPSWLPSRLPKVVGPLKAVLQLMTFPDPHRKDLERFSMVNWASQPSDKLKAQAVSPHTSWLCVLPVGQAGHMIGAVCHPLGCTSNRFIHQMHEECVLGRTKPSQRVS